jgi:hypothetical protein
MSLLFEAFSAYLDPLIVKHAAGKVLVWEDLTSSHAAVTTFLQPYNNIFVEVRYFYSGCSASNIVDHTRPFAP